jgi:hypothetical protein
VTGPALARRPRVVFSYGLGADSTAILLRWLFEPSSRDFALEDLVVVTAMTGDEWPVTGQLVEQHVLPLLRRHGARYIQAARGQRHVTKAGDGVVVLDDSTAPGVLFIEGLYRLSDEMFEAGTVPQTGGARLCSVHAKGDVLDPIIAAVTDGEPYRHVLGFEANELGRIRRDRRYDTETRTGVYPLLDWGWDRAACIRFIAERTGVPIWPKSACTFCPFALCTRDGLAATLTRYAQEDPAAGATALLMEHAALAFNPRQGLIAGDRLVDQLRAGVDRYAAVLDAFEARLEATPHAVYEVRRVYRPAAADPARVANAARCLQRHAVGTRAEMRGALDDVAASHGAAVVVGADGIARVYLERRHGSAPGVERFLVVAPARAGEKAHQSFQAWYAQAIAARARAATQMELISA